MSERQRSPVCRHGTPAKRVRVGGRTDGRAPASLGGLDSDPRTLAPTMGVRTSGQMGSADPPRKMDEKLKSENMPKRAVF